MKNAALILILSLSLGTGAVAQSQSSNRPAGAHQKNMSPDEKAVQSANRAEKELGLTADQKQKWQAAELQHQNAVAPIKSKLDGSTTPEERRDLHQQMQSQHQAFETQVKTFLTADQASTFDQLKADRKQNNQKKRGKMN